MKEYLSLADSPVVLLAFTTKNTSVIPRSLFCLNVEKAEARQAHLVKKEITGNANRVLIKPGYAGPKDDPQRVDAQLLPAQLERSGFVLIKASVQRREAVGTSNEHFAIRFRYVHRSILKMDESLREFEWKYGMAALFGLESLLDFALWKLRVYKNPPNPQSTDPMMERFIVTSINFDSRKQLLTTFFELENNPPTHTLTYQGKRLILESVNDTPSMHPKNTSNGGVGNTPKRASVRI